MTVTPQFTNDTDTGSCGYDPNIGETRNSADTELAEVIGFPITVNFPSEDVVYTQVQYRWHEHTVRPVEGEGNWRKRLNERGEVVDNGAMTLVVGFSVTGGDEVSPTQIKLQCSDDECGDGVCTDGDGSYYDVGDGFNGRKVRFTQEFPQTYQDKEAITTRLLPLPDGREFVTGMYYTTSGLFDPVVREDGDYTEKGYSLRFDGGVDEQIVCRLVLGNGGVFDVYTEVIQVVIRQGIAHGF
jgi:hypothetical protein